MAAQADLTVTDSVPTNLTFSAQRSDGTLATWIEKSSGMWIGNPVLTLGHRIPVFTDQGTYKVTLKLKVPVLEVTSPSTGTGIQPAPTIAYTNLGSVELVMSSRSDLTERKDLLAMLRSALNNAVVYNAVTDYAIPS